jgi:hypothetical protein
MKRAAITQLKCGVVFAFVSLAFVSQASAVLRPLFPIKSAAPINGEVIVIGDELVLRSAKKPRLHPRANGQGMDSRIWFSTHELFSR